MMGAAVFGLFSVNALQGDRYPPYDKISTLEGTWLFPEHGPYLTTDKEMRMKTSSSAKILVEAINRAIEDHIITNSEYEEILHIANEDGIIDPEERALLSQLQEMIADRTVRRMAD